MQTSEQKTQSELGYTEEEIRSALEVNLSMFTQSGMSPTDHPVVSYLSKYIFALVSNAYEKGKITTPEQVDIDKSPIGIASHELHEKYFGQSWFMAVGIAKDELIIYTKTKNVPQKFDSYKGIPIKYKYMGNVEVKLGGVK